MRLAKKARGFNGAKGLSANELLELMAEFVPTIKGGLRVNAPTPEYLFAMKCMAMRPEGVDGSHDISDIEFLIKEADIQDAVEALEIIEGFYPKSLVPAKVSFGVRTHDRWFWRPVFYR